MEPKKIIRMPNYRTMRREKQLEALDFQALIKSERRTGLLKTLGIILLSISVTIGILLLAAFLVL